MNNGFFPLKICHLATGIIGGRRKECGMYTKCTFLHLICRTALQLVTILCVLNKVIWPIRLPSLWMIELGFKPVLSDPKACVLDSVTHFFPRARGVYSAVTLGNIGLHNAWLDHFFLSTLTLPGLHVSGYEKWRFQLGKALLYLLAFFTVSIHSTVYVNCCSVKTFWKVPCPITVQTEQDVT